MLVLYLLLSEIYVVLSLLILRLECLSPIIFYILELLDSRNSCLQAILSNNNEVYVILIYCYSPDIITNSTNHTINLEY